MPPLKGVAPNRVTAYVDRGHFLCERYGSVTGGSPSAAADRSTFFLGRYAQFNGNFVLVALSCPCGLEADGTNELIEIVHDFLI
jgi:hypothetical protein